MNIIFSPVSTFRIPILVILYMHLSVDDISPILLELPNRVYFLESQEEIMEMEKTQVDLC